MSPRRSLKKVRHIGGTYTSKQKTSLKEKKATAAAAEELKNIPEKYLPHIDTILKNPDTIKTIKKNLGIQDQTGIIRKPSAFNVANANATKFGTAVLAEAKKLHAEVKTLHAEAKKRDEASKPITIFQKLKDQLLPKKK
jgi:hypothetical protein